MAHPLQEFFVHLAYIDDSGRQSGPVVLYGALIIPDTAFISLHAFAGVAASMLFPGKVDEQFTEFKACDLVLGRPPYDQVSQEQRDTVIGTLLGAIKLPSTRFVYSAVNTTACAESIFASADVRDIAFQMCLLGIEGFVCDNNPGELSPLDPKRLTVVAVDETGDDKLKIRMRQSFQRLRSRLWNVDNMATFHKTRIWHIHDAMYFCNSADSVGLQMADLCAFLVSGHLKRLHDERTQAMYDQIKDRLTCAKPEPEWSRYKDFLLEHS